MNYAYSIMFYSWVKTAYSNPFSPYNLPTLKAYILRTKQNYEL